jgi:hypothetical protein
LTIEKIALLTPMPSAKQRIAAMASTGERRSCLTAKVTSAMIGVESVAHGLLPFLLIVDAYRLARSLLRSRQSPIEPRRHGVVVLRQIAAPDHPVVTDPSRRLLEPVVRVPETLDTYERSPSARGPF